MDRNMFGMQEAGEIAAGGGAGRSLPKARFWIIAALLVAFGGATLEIALIIITMKFQDKRGSLFKTDHINGTANWPRPMPLR